MLTERLREDARLLFNRVFELPSSADEESARLNDEMQREFLKLETSLNDAKSELSDKDPVAWREHTANCNRSSLVKYRLKQILGHDVPLVTQAFVKFFEILAVHGKDLVKRSNLKTFHLCEAPGAFISALDQYLLQRFSTSAEWSWQASTLNPYFEGNSTEHTFVDDRLIFETLDKWVFGQSGTGNVFMLDIDETMQNRYDLVTADGSIDCQDCPGEQEMTVYPLFCAEVRCAMRLLANDGCLVIKLFTFFHRETRELLNVLWRAFDSITIRKPACSRCSNSEVYVVCVGYRAETGARLLSKLDRLVNSNGELCGSMEEGLAKNFEQSLLDASLMFTQWQIAAIRTNLNYFSDMTRRDKEKLDMTKRMVADMYVTKLHVQKLSPDVASLRQIRIKVLAKMTLSKGRAWNVVSYEDRKKAGWQKDYAKDLLDRLRELHPKLLSAPQQDDIVYERKRDPGLFSVPLGHAMQIATGNVYPKVTVSKFIDQSLLDLYYMMFPLREAADIGEKPTPTPSRELTVSLTANLSSHDTRLSFLRNAEQELAGYVSRTEPILLEVAFSETLSRFAAGLVLLLVWVFDEVEYAVGRLDSICFTFTADSGQRLTEVLNAITVVRKELEKCPRGLTVTEIFPLRTICLSNFFIFLRQCNERFYAVNKAAVELLRLAEENKQEAVSEHEHEVALEQKTSQIRQQDESKVHYEQQHENQQQQHKGHQEQMQV